MQGAVCVLAVKGAVVLEKYAVGRVHKRIAQAFGHQLAAEILASGSGIVLSHPAFQAGADGLKILVQRKIRTQGILQKGKTLLDPVKNPVKGLLVSVLRRIVAGVEQIGDLFISRKSFSRGGNHHKPALFLGLDNGNGFAEPSGIRKGTAPEFGNLQQFIVHTSVFLSGTVFCKKYICV